MKGNGSRKQSILRICCCMILALAMTVTLIPTLGMSDAYAAGDSGKATYDKVMKLEEPDNYKDESFEPYGYGVDVPFMMNKQSELLFYQTSPDSSGDISTFYDALKTADTGDVPDGTKTSKMKAPPEKLKKAYFVKAVSFDPTGTGRDDHIAFIGVYWDNDHARAYVWVYNTRKRTWSSEFDLGSDGGLQTLTGLVGTHTCDWMEEDHITDYQATHFISITAGDYNGDGKDTLVAYAAFSGEDGYSLYELECKNLKVGYYGSKYKGAALRHDWYGAWLSKKDDVKTKMACDLDTGDINGDGLDDLVALTYMGNWGDTSQNAVIYRPMVSASYGKAGGSGFTKKCDYWMGAWQWYEGWKFNNMVSPGLSVGDVDNDGKDEMAVAGIKCLTKMKNSDTTEICNEIDSNKKTFAMIFGDNGGDNDSGTNLDYCGTVDTNAWMKQVCS